MQITYIDETIDKARAERRIRENMPMAERAAKRGNVTFTHVEVDKNSCGMEYLMWHGIHNETGKEMILPRTYPSDSM